MKILFTTPVLEYPPSGGPTLRIANSIKGLNTIVELHVISRVNIKKMGGIKAEEFYKKYCYNFEYSLSAKKYIFNKIFTFRFKSRISLLNYFLNMLLRILAKNLKMIGGTIGDANFISNYAKKNKIDIIWFGYGNVSFELMKEVKKRLPKLKMVCDTDSVWSRFILRELETLNNVSRIKEIEESGRKKELEEKEWCKFMDVTTAVSDVDAEYYRCIAKDRRNIKLFSNVLDLNAYSIKQQPLKNFKKPCIYLAGTFWKGSPMEHAARWVINDVLPIIIKTIPNIHFYIVGTGSAKILADIKEPNITVTGKLDSVLPYLCNVNVALVPLKFESGTRFKILEAGACGIPIVSTTLGAEGIPVTDGYDILIADEADKFAESIVKLITDKELSNKLSKNCKNLIQNKYSVEALIEEAKEIIEYLNGFNND